MLKERIITWPRDRKSGDYGSGRSLRRSFGGCRTFARTSEPIFLLTISRRRCKSFHRRVFRRDQHSLQSSFYSSMRISYRVRLRTAARWPSSMTTRHGLWVYQRRAIRGSSRKRLYRCSKSGSGPAALSSKRRRRPLSTLLGIKKRAEMLPRRSDLRERDPTRGKVKILGVTLDKERTRQARPLRWRWPYAD